jgi:hypothetical protein
MGLFKELELCPAESSRAKGFPGKYCLAEATGSTLLDVKLVLKTTDRALIGMTY